MKFISDERSKLLRQSRNLDVVRRMRAGENLASFNSQASWYPPRPNIEKDQQALDRLYGTESGVAVHKKEEHADGTSVFPMKVS